MLSPSQIQTLEELDKWQAVIDTPEKWTKNAAARDKAGERVIPEHKDAVRWCLIGAEVRTFGLKKYAATEASRIIRKLAKGMSCFNDDPSTTHADVMALFERAKEKVRNG